MEEILHTPTIEEFSDNVLRIRRNLMFIASICLFYKINGLELSGAGGFLGIYFKAPPSPSAIDNAFFVLVFYHLIHFLLLSAEKINLIRLRVTSEANGEMRELGETVKVKPTQATIYQWWYLQRRCFSAFKFDELLAALRQTNQENERLLPSAALDIAKNELSSQIFSNKEKIDMVADNVRMVRELAETISSGRIERSLKAFDNWFALYQTKQLLRWSIIEIEIPIILGIAAIYYTWPF